MCEYRIIKEVKLCELEALYRDAGWWDDSFDAQAFVPDMIKNSFCVIGAFDKSNKLIGIGRALSDGISDAYIQDVCVLKAMRGTGIGSKIVKLLIEELKDHHIDWIGLVGEPKTRSFYERLGFRELKDHIPMKLDL